MGAMPAKEDSKFRGDLKTRTQHSALFGGRSDQPFAPLREGSGGGQIVKMKDPTPDTNPEKDLGKVTNLGGGHR